MAWVNNMGNGNPNLHPVIVKNGGTVGFGTVIVINPSKDLALFIAVNQAWSNPAGKGVEIVLIPAYHVVSFRLFRFWKGEKKPGR